MKNGGLKIFMALKSCFIANMLTTAFCLFHSEHDAIICFDYINFRHPNIRVTMEKGARHKISFLDVIVDNNYPNSFLTIVYCTKTFTGLLTNYFTFAWYSYKVGLIRTLVDRAYKSNNT